MQILCVPKTIFFYTMKPTLTAASFKKVKINLDMN